MTDLVAELKARLTVQDVIARTHALVPAGGGRLKGQAGFSSLTVDPRKQVWSWWAQGAGAEQKVIGGDLYSWIAYNRFGRTKVDSKDFIEVLKEACSIAGLNYEESTKDRKPDPERDRRRALEKEKRETLAAYLETAAACWTPEARVQARQRKPYLTADVIESWQLGCAPKLKACLDAGMTEKQLRSVRLLVDPISEGLDEYSRMHFRDSIIVPWFEAGEVVFLSARRLVDYDGQGNKLPDKWKSPSMYGPRADGTGGMAKPVAFNLETIRSLFDAKANKAENVKELLLVEGPLDAIACEEQGHAAIALGCSAPAPELVARLAGYPQVVLYLALDGTADVTPLSRAAAAGTLGIYTRVCELPAGKDPDDLSGAELAGVKAGAVDAIDCWCALVK